MIILNINRESSTPIFKQVINQLKEKIDNDILKPGDRLPATRVFSTQLGVNRTTIYKAYQELWAQGYIESRSGSYSYVRQRRENCTENNLNTSHSIDWTERINHRAEKVFKMYGKISFPFSEEKEKFEGIDFSVLHPDKRLFPVAEFKKSMSRIMLERGETILDYGEGQGYTPLREFIAHRQRRHGITVNASEVLITNGAQNAIDLLLKLFVKPGSRVFTESPTYGMMIPALTYYGCEIVPIPMKEDGADLSIIEKEFKKGLPAFFYTMPNFQNPTGVTTFQDHREKLIALFEKYNIPIVEDAFEEEMKYFGKVPLPIKSMDINQIVIYVGSFSKILFPGIRLGWISADAELIKRIITLKRITDISTTLPEQAALADFCRQGFFDHHIKRIHKIYRKRMQTAICELQKKIKNKNVKWLEPNGGFTFWLTFENTSLSYEELNKIFCSNNIRLALGKDFFPYPEKKKCFRMSIASVDEEEIINGIGRLAKACKQVYG